MYELSVKFATCVLISKVALISLTWHLFLKNVTWRTLRQLYIYKVIRGHMG